MLHLLKAAGGVKKIGTLDRRNRANAHARMRTLVKRILRKYGYPSYLHHGAFRTATEKAEVILAEFGY